MPWHGEYDIFRKYSFLKQVKKNKSTFLASTPKLPSNPFISPLRCRPEEKPVLQVLREADLREMMPLDAAKLGQLQVRHAVMPVERAWRNGERPSGVITRDER